MFNFCPNCGNKIQNKAEDFKCSECKKAFYTNSRPTATVIPVFNNELLVGIRANEPKKGEYDFLGGFLHSGEHPLDGAVREFKEETGVEIDKNELEYLDIWIDEYEYQDEKLFTFNMIYVWPVKEKIMVQVADDVAGVKWVSMDDDIAMAFESQNETLQKLKDTYS